MFWVEFSGASCRLSPRLSDELGTLIVSECVLWPCRLCQLFPPIVFPSVPTFALHMSREQRPPAQFRISVAKRLGSGESYRVSLLLPSVGSRAVQDNAHLYQ